MTAVTLESIAKQVECVLDEMQATHNEMRHMNEDLMITTRHQRMTVEIARLQEENKFLRGLIIGDPALEARFDAFNKAPKEI